MSRRSGARRLKPVKLLWADGGPTVWLVQHDSQELWLSHWYRLGCPDCGPDKGGIEFDVRAVPGFTEYPVAMPGGVGWLDKMPAWIDARRRHHAEIIACALDADWLPVTL